MLGSLEFVAMTSLVVVLLTAGVSKVVSKERSLLRALAAVEVCSAAALLVPSLRTAAFAVVALLGVGFTVYAQRVSAEPCRCFGARFHVRSRAASLSRAGAVFVLALTGLLVRILGPPQEIHWIASSIVVGAVIGGAVVVLPALTAIEGSTEGGLAHDV